MLILIELFKFRSCLRVLTNSYTCVDSVELNLGISFFIFGRGDKYCCYFDDIYQLQGGILCHKPIAVFQMYLALLSGEDLTDERTWNQRLRSVPPGGKQCFFNLGTHIR